MLYKPGYNYHKAGIIALEIVPKEQVQNSLWDEGGNLKNAAVMKTLDAVNKAMGTDSVRFCRQGYNKKWKLRMEHLSKCYTTRLDHVVRVGN